MKISTVVVVAMGALLSAYVGLSSRKMRQQEERIKVLERELAERNAQQREASVTWKPVQGTSLELGPLPMGLSAPIQGLGPLAFIPPLPAKSQG